MNMYAHRSGLLFIVAMVATASFTASAQRVMTESEVVDVALRNNAQAQVAGLQVQQNTHLEKTAFNLPNPEVLAESPTGEFYAVGVLQAIEFPSVYFKQRQLRKEITRLSRYEETFTRHELTRMIRSLYVDLQYFDALLGQRKVQDSLYARLRETATRQFDAGQIDYLVKTITETQYAEVHNLLVQTQHDRATLLSQLQIHTGVADSFATTPLTPYADNSITQAVKLTNFDSLWVAGNPSLAFAKQQQHVSEKNLSMERNKTLPGLVVGYLNQGPRNTDTQYRFRVGLTVPLWFWQYSGNIKAARAGVAMAEKNARAQQQSITAEMLKASGDLRKYQQALTYYETRGMKHADEMISVAKRFFESGQIDHNNYLRTLHDAYQLKVNYLEAVRLYNQSMITINFLTGTP